MTDHTANAAEPTLVEGVDIDAAAAAVRSCPGVADLDAGRLGAAVSYLPGRTLAGLSVEADRIKVAVRARWGTTTGELLAQITAALAAPGLGRPVEVTVADIDLPETAPDASDVAPAAASGNGTPVAPAPALLAQGLPAPSVEVTVPQPPPTLPGSLVPDPYGALGQPPSS